MSSPYIRYKGELTELTHLNDFLELPFSTIADIIEEQVEGV